MAVHVFDFDGVLICGRYDAIYRLEEEVGEAELLSWACGHYGLMPDRNLAYNRHRVVQAWMNEQDMSSVTGPLFDKVKEVHEAGMPWYILTARSTEDAIVMVGKFLDEHGLNPLETFFVGRAGKTAQLKWLSDFHSDRDIYFYDDSAGHIADAKDLNLSNLHAELIDDGNDRVAGRVLYEQIQLDLEQRRKDD